MMSGEVKIYRVKKYLPDKKCGIININTGKRGKEARFNLHDIVNQEHMHWMKNNCIVKCKIKEDKDNVAKEVKIVPELLSPVDTAKIIVSFHTKIDNINLMFNKFPGFKVVNHNLKYSLEYKDVKQLNNIFSRQKELLEAFKARFGSNIKLLKKQGYIFNSGKSDGEDGDVITMSSRWRVASGLGSPSVYDNSLILHHVYGIPYLPGSAVKGVTRSWVVQEYFSNNEDEARKSDIFSFIFGTQQRQGKIIFFDAYINFTQDPFFLDVMTPHYSKYYSNKRQFPTDNDWPKLITFLTVKEDAVFDFYLGAHEKDNKPLITEHFKCQKLIDVKNKNGTIHSLAVKFFKEAMENHGIGAKTSLGYGFFNVVKP